MFNFLLNIVSDNGKPDFTVGGPAAWFEENAAEFWLIAIISFLLGIFVSFVFFTLKKGPKQENSQHKENTDNSYEESDE